MSLENTNGSCPIGARNSCALCPAASRCILAGLAESDRARWEQAQRRVALPSAGQGLFTAGDEAAAVFIVRAGCIKTYSMDGDGNERVRGFFFPGDVIGLEALGASRYPSSATAVVPSQVCRLSCAHLQSLMAASPALARKIVERVSADLRQSLALAGDYSADQRLAAFLLQMQQRLANERNVVRLPMTRRDIGNHLRLATETVCRVLARFEQNGWVAAADKTLTVHRPAALWELAAPVGVARPAPVARLAA